MKILYVTPSIDDAGGLSRVLSVKANYLSETLGYTVHILTQNKSKSPLFYDLSPTIVLHNMVLERNKIQFLFQYIKSLKKHIEEIKPDVIIICDNGIKAYLIPFLLKTNIPLVFELHGSRYVQESEINSISARIKSKLINFIKEMGTKRFSKFVVLSEFSQKEWKNVKTDVIPNPVWIHNESKVTFQYKKVIAVSRHSYEKGIDRLLVIWKEVISKHPDWILDIYGKSDTNKTYIKLAEALNLSKNVNFHEPVSNIEEKYLESYMFLMTSRHEGFPMVLLEALAVGLPCIAYDCPVGPRAIIKNNKTGFLIPEEDSELFIAKICSLIENKELAMQMGLNAQNSTEYKLDVIMKQWDMFFKNLIQ